MHYNTCLLSRIVIIYILVLGYTFSINPFSYIIPCCRITCTDSQLYFPLCTYCLPILYKSNLRMSIGYQEPLVYLVLLHCTAITLFPGLFILVSTRSIKEAKKILTKFAVREPFITIILLLIGLLLYVFVNHSNMK